MKTLYSISLILIAIFSWGFVDANMPLPRFTQLMPFIYNHTVYLTTWYVVTVLVLFGWYLRMLRRARNGDISSKAAWCTILLTVGVLFWSFPAFSNDVFNYIASAKVAFLYRENPYVIMPIEISNEPMLSFLHAANKVALYGPSWIALTMIPHYVGMGNLLLTLFTFKIFVTGWYLLLCFLIWSASGKKTWPLVFFALNPLVILSTLVDAHNDIVMMVLALESFLLLKQKRNIFGLSLLVISIFIKGATVILLPVYVWCWYCSRLKKKIKWQQIWYWASISMYIVFFLSPLREEMYAWYFIWPLTFVSLIETTSILHAVSYGFSLGLSLRIVPFLYTRSWIGITPWIKKIVTITIPLAWGLYYAVKKKY